MKKLLIKIVLPLIACMIFVTFLLGALSIWKGKNAYKTEVEEKLLYASGSYAKEFSLIFENMNGMVNSLAAQTSVLFDVHQCLNDEQTFTQCKQIMSEIIYKTLLETDQISGLYLTFNPKVFTGKEEIWFAFDEKGQIKLMDAAATAPTWLLEGNPNVDYYYNAVQNGSYWGGLDYEWSLDTYMVTHTKSVYDAGGSLIGIVGTDILMDDIIHTVTEMKIYEGSKAILFDTDFKCIAQSSKQHISGRDKEKLKEKVVDSKNSSGIFRYHSSEGITQMAAFSYLSNGWILMIMQPENLVFMPINQTRSLIIFAMISSMLLIVAMIIYVIRRSFMPVLQDIELKEIMLLTQSRQAKLGEMVGNIAHQWKQPLNGIGITISNLEDDFKCDELHPLQFEKYVAKMRLLITNMSETIDDFTNFLKPNRKKEAFCINDEVKHGISLMEESIRVNSISVIVSDSPPLIIEGFKNEFCQAVFNVLNNARDAIMESNPEERLIEIKFSGRYDEKQDKSSAVILISNNGNRITEENLSKVFHPYFTTKHSEEGLGIGLYLTRQIIEEHFGGTIRLFNEENGVSCEIAMPMGKNPIGRETELQ